MIQDEKQVDMAHLPSIDSESGSPPDYSSLPQSDPDVEKAFAPAPPSWDVKDSKTSAPSEEPPRRRKTFRLLASLLALCLLLHLFSHPFHSRTDRRAVRGYVTSYKSTSNWSGPTEPLRGINFIKSIYWRLRTRPGWRHRFGKPVYDAKKPLTAKAAEKLFLSVPTNDSAQAASHSYTGFSHLAGTEGDRKSAALVKYQWEQLLGLPTTDEYENVFDAGTKESRRMLLGGRHGRCRGRGGRRGWKTKRSQRHGHGHGHGRRQRLSPTSPRVWTDRYYPLLSFPHNGSSLQLLSPSGEATFNATLFEDAIELDPTASHGSANDPPFHGYSFPGWAEGELVYANEGTKADFEALEREGIDVKGKVVLVRYGAVFRGLKVTAAERRRAVGVIIYTDPSEDGHTTVSNGFTPYPHGPARNPSSLQRGSVQTLSFYPGDPLTPGKPAYKDAKRIDRKEKEINVPGIPSLPLSGKEGKVLLESLKGKGKKLGGKWDGGFEDVDYWTGPGEKVRLFNNVTEKVTPIWCARVSLQ